LKFRLWWYNLKKRREKRKLNRADELHTDRELWAQKNAIIGSRGEQDFDQAGVGKSKNSMGPN
jgi:hypothetical protein